MRRMGWWGGGESFSAAERERPHPSTRRQRRQRRRRDNSDNSYLKGLERVARLQFKKRPAVAPDQTPTFFLKQRQPLPPKLPPMPPPPPAPCRSQKEGRNLQPPPTLPLTHKSCGQKRGEGREKERGGILQGNRQSRTRRRQIREKGGRGWTSGARWSEKQRRCDRLFSSRQDPFARLPPRKTPGFLRSQSESRKKGAARAKEREREGGGEDGLGRRRLQGSRV